MPDQIDISNPVSIAEAVRRNKGKPLQISAYFLQGIFGELADCSGICEEIIDTDEKLKKYGLDPAEGGTFLKIVGCSYLYKGNPEQWRVFGMEQAKSNISTLPREIIAESRLYSAAIALRFLFQRRKFIHDLHVFFNEIRHKTIRHVSPPEIRLNQMTREIRQAMDKVVKKEFKIDPAFDLYNATPDDLKFSDIEPAALIVKMVVFGTLIMEFDGAYRFPTQDMLGETDKENAQRSGAREMLRLLDLMIERNINLTPIPPEMLPTIPGITDRTSGVPEKFRFIKKAMRILFFLSSQSRRIIRNFLLELDIDKVKLDDADWYFCLRRNTHNYRGVPITERLKELARIDRERGHQYVKIEFKPATGPAPKVEAVMDPPKT